MYNGGVMIAADTKGSYGSLSRFMHIERLFKATDKAVVACGGDIADYQLIRDVIEQKVYVFCFMQIIYSIELLLLSIYKCIISQRRRGQDTNIHTHTT